MHRILGATLLGFLGLLTIAAQEPKPLDPEVLTRGPIHEAYASSVSVAPQPGPIAGKAPPELIDELPPDEKPDGEVTWIPGYWHWDEERTDFIWISGFWRSPPPGRQWVPGTWRQAGDGFQWSSGFWAGAQSQQIEYVPPPPAPLETAASTPAPGENYLYAPGNWVYRDTRYAWRPGFWYAYRPDWVYIPAHYVWSPCGYVFVDGYWDYPLRRRGVLFAPVYFSPTLYVRPVFRYRPSIVLYDEALYGCLFVRPGFNAYYFGDYFEARYTNVGYRSWFDVRIGVGAYDPLWGYYRHHYAATPGWSIGITTLYANRYSGVAPRPARTFVQQNVVVNNVTNTTVINNTTINNVKNVTLAAPINKVDKTVVNLKPVSAAEQQAAVKSSRDIRNASTERVKLEGQALAQAKTNAPGKANTPVQPIRINTPTTTAKDTTAPPAPPSPKDQPKANSPQPKDAPKATTPPPLPKDQPKGTPPQPKDSPKDSPKTTPPLPKEQPKTPPPLPKDQPKGGTPQPQPKEQPKTPPPLPKEQPKTTTPPPQPKEQPKAPPTPTPQPKAPPPPPIPAPQPKSPPPPQPKNNTPPKGDAPKGKGGKNDPPQQSVNVPPPNNFAPRPMAPATGPKGINPPQRPAPRPAEKGKDGKDKAGDRPKQ